MNFKTISSEDFLAALDWDAISSIEIFGHTGTNIVDPLLQRLEKATERESDHRLKEIEIRILLRSPYAEIKRRSARINRTVQRIRQCRRRGFHRLHLQFYENLPHFRAILCTRRPGAGNKNCRNNNRIAYLSFYYFPDIDTTSKKYSHALIVDESTHAPGHPGPDHLVNICSSWFDYFWGKTKKEFKRIHTLILDFDDTIVDSHGIQIGAWVELTEEARRIHGLRPSHFRKAIRDVLDNPKGLEEEIGRIFFLKQKAPLIFSGIFCRLSPVLTDMLHQRRFEIRRQKMRAAINRVRLFPHAREVLTSLSARYHLVIVSATDEEMIIDYLGNLPVGDTGDAGGKRGGTLYDIFRYVFGKKEPAFDWKYMKRKSRLIIKVINLLGIPIERMVYIGDNHSDYTEASAIGIRFVEARLFGKELKKAIGRESLISGDDDARHPYFTDWRHLPRILRGIEEGDCNREEFDLK